MLAPTPKILLLEGERANGSSFAPHLRKRYEVLIAHTGKQALGLLAQAPQVLVLDSLSMRTSGARLCHSLRQECQTLPIIHLKRADGEEDSEDSPANVSLIPPFTYRKVLNRIKDYVALQIPADSMLVWPHWQFHPQQGLLICPTGEANLNPKLAAILALLMRQAGQVVSRPCLMQEVWGVETLEDTRTLDVHMRWLRQTLEAATKRTGWIKTRRGQGYVLLNPSEVLKTAEGPSAKLAKPV